MSDEKATQKEKAEEITRVVRGIEHMFGVLEQLSDRLKDEEPCLFGGPRDVTFAMCCVLALRARGQGYDPSASLQAADAFCQMLVASGIVRTEFVLDIRKPLVVN